MLRSEYVVKRTSELALGDIVHCHGMRCLIDGEIHVSKSHPASRDGSKTLYTQALVLNREDASTDAVPRSWTADWKRNARHEALPHEGVHRWTIQGNDLATWAVEAQA